jgi:hypothetical protein
MEFVETPTFSRQVLALLNDDEYRDLQVSLASNPTIGAVISGGGGLRKMRWAGKGHGKRGGLRVIYYFALAKDLIWMLLIYPKSEQDELTSEQLRTLRILVKEFLNEG